MKKMVAIIQSMTVRERTEPDIIKGSRRRRIAQGAGSSVQEVNLLLSEFKQMKQMLGQFANKKGAGLKGLQLPRW
jgi:signal recognition particle subunit SRP54